MKKVATITPAALNLMTYVHKLAVDRYGSHPWSAIVRQLDAQERQALGGGTPRQLTSRMSARFGSRQIRGPEPAYNRVIVKYACTNDAGEVDEQRHQAELATVEELYEAAHGTGAMLADASTASKSRSTPTDDLQRRLDEMTSQVAALQEKVGTLEDQNASLRNQLKQALELIKPPPPPSAADDDTAGGDLVRPNARVRGQPPVVLRATTTAAVTSPTGLAPRAPNAPPIPPHQRRPRAVPTSPPVAGPPPQLRQLTGPGQAAPATRVVTAPADQRRTTTPRPPAMIPPAVPLPRRPQPPVPRRAELDLRTTRLIELQDKLLQQPQKSRRPRRWAIEASCDDSWADLPRDRWEADDYLVANLAILGVVLTIICVVYGPFIVATIL